MSGEGAMTLIVAAAVVHGALVGWFVGLTPEDRRLLRRKRPRL
jgi:hypothetical protein